MAFSRHSQFSQFSRSVVSDSLWPHGLQHTRLPCPSPTPRVYSNSCPLSWWCHPTISSSVIPVSSHLQSFPASGSFQMSQFFTSGAKILEFQLQHQSFQFRTDLTSLQSKGFSRIFSNTTVQKHQFYGTQLSLHIDSVQTFQVSVYLKLLEEQCLLKRYI